VEEAKACVERNQQEAAWARQRAEEAAELAEQNAEKERVCTARP